MNKIIKSVKDYSKESYKDAICDACDDIKSRVDDILVDFNKYLQGIDIHIKVGIGEVSVLEINKVVFVMSEPKENE